jgi:phosphoenolpyruvate carboxylase
MRKIPSSMATQHPDNANMPPWSNGDIIQGDAEVYEAYFSYKELGIEEVMWDAEGKDVDAHVVRKLLSGYPEYFKERKLGEDIFLTYRIPNPRVEYSERKLVSEILESIATSYDVAKEFHGYGAPPIFEVILPLTSSFKELILVKRYYERVVCGKDSIKLFEDTSVLEWLGETNPKSIEVIPLIEDKESLYRVEEIISGYVRVTKSKLLRVFIARSDPALNYGLISAVVLAKYALAKLSQLEEKLDVEIFPIIGVGPPTFRGNFNPENVDNVLNEYPSAFTFTVQSAFRYDYSVQTVKKAVTKINSLKRSRIEELELSCQK